MKIIYLAKHHNCRSNDDEGSISHALKKLGHEVRELPERKSADSLSRQRGDFLLFHHYKSIETLKCINLPKVCWCFDLIDFPDERVGQRNNHRKRWINSIATCSDLVLLTDGDWVAKNNHTGNLVQLMQGADQRIIRDLQVTDDNPYMNKILFPGTYRRREQERLMFYFYLLKLYGNRVIQVENKFGTELSLLVNSCSVTVCPDVPNTDSYWSNRVYITQGFRGLTIHPYCKDLTRHYEEDNEIVFYRNRDDLKDKIDFYSDPKNKAKRDEIAHAGYIRTKRQHTYLHRCRDMIKIVKERIL